MRAAAIDEEMMAIIEMPIFRIVVIRVFGLVKKGGEIEVKKGGERGTHGKRLDKGKAYRGVKKD